MVEFSYHDLDYFSYTSWRFVYYPMLGVQNILLNPWMKAPATKGGTLVLMSTANTKSIISHVALNRYLNPSKPLGMNFTSADKIFIGE